MMPKSLRIIRSFYKRLWINRAQEILKNHGHETPGYNLKDPEIKNS